MSEAAPLSITPDHVQRARAAADDLAGDISLSGRRVLAALGLVAMGASRVKAAERAGVPHGNQLAPSQWHRVGLTDEMVSRIQRDLGAPPPAPQPTAAAPKAPNSRPHARNAPVHANAPKRSTVARHGPADIKPEEVVDLRPTHPAVIRGHSIFSETMVVGAQDAPRLLVSGHNNTKLGREVLKGERAGWPIFQLSLEERATCPRSCPVWAGCYGNAMPFARRHRADADLMRVLRSEVAGLAKLHPAGFLVRLHTLGDFFSVEYVLMWAELLATTPALHVFGYTARREDDEDAETRKIAKAIAILTTAMWGRFAIRTSHPEFGPQRSVVVMADPGLPDVIMCPAQTGATEACATCGLCWAQAARDKAIGFLKHGMKRGGRRKAEPADTTEEAPPVVVTPVAERPLTGTRADRIIMDDLPPIDATELDIPAAPRPDREELHAGANPGQADPAPAVVQVPPLKPDQRAFLDAAPMRPSVYDPSVVIGGPKPARRKPTVVTDAGRFVRMKPITADIVRWCRAYVATGVVVDYLADLFDVDAEALSRAVAA